MTAHLSIHKSQSANESANQALYVSTQATPKRVTQPVVTKTPGGRPLTIRPAQATDAPHLAAIGAKGFAMAHAAAFKPDEMKRVLAHSWREEHLAETLADPDMQILVAQMGPSIVGLVGIDPSNRPAYIQQPGAVEICRFYLHLDWLGLGIGSTLMNHALHQATVSGNRIAWLRVWQGNKGTIHFYRQWGFSTIATDSYSTGGAQTPVWVMIHSLTGMGVKTNIQWQ